MCSLSLIGEIGRCPFSSRDLQTERKLDLIKLNHTRAYMTSLTRNLMQIWTLLASESRTQNGKLHTMLQLSRKVENESFAGR